MKAIGRLVVDTNAVIAYREGVPGACDAVEEADVIFLPAVVFGELLYGAANSARRAENEEAVRRFLAQSVLVPLGEDIAARYASVRLDLKDAGHPIPENDIWVAATCLELNADLLSRDAHFAYVSGLRVIDWSRP